MAYRNSPYKVATTIKNGYDPYRDVRNIKDRKADYDYYDTWSKIYGTPKTSTTITGNGDVKYINPEAEQKKKQAHQIAMPSYTNLSNNGYSQTATDLNNMGQKAAGGVVDYFAAQGKTPIREYYYSRGKKYGLSKDDIDSKLRWDDGSGQVYFGGQLVGTPDGITESGVSYWNDKSKLDAAFDNVAQNEGWTVPSGNIANQAWQTMLDNAKKGGNTTAAWNDELMADSQIGRDVISDWRKQYNDFGNSINDARKYADQDITKTDEYKSVIPLFTYNADTAALNGAADSASTNGGNIDSFAAANARRQREASLASGTAAAAQLYLDRINGMNAVNQTAAGGLSEGRSMYDSIMGGITGKTQAANLISESGNRVNNDLRGLVESIYGYDKGQAEARLTDAQARYTDAQTEDLYGSQTGYATNEALKRNNRFYDKNANITNINNDFSAIMSQAQRRIKELESIPAAQRTAAQNAELNDQKNLYNEAYTAREDKRGLDEYKNTEYISNPYYDSFRRVYGPYAEARYMTDANNQTSLNEAQIGANSAENLEKIKADSAVTQANIAAEVENNTLKENARQFDATLATGLLSGTAGNTADDTANEAVPMTDEEVKNAIMSLNEDLKSKLGVDDDGNSLRKITQNGVNMYNVPADVREYVIKQVLSSNLSDKKKKYLLVDKMAVSAGEISNVSTDIHNRNK